MADNLNSEISKYLVPGLVSCASVVGVVKVLQKLGLIYRVFHPVDEKSSKHGGELVASVLQAHGVKFVFTLVGGHISPILVGCEKLGIRVIDTRHEVNAVFAADAVARLSGVIGVAVVTAGPGVTNTITAVKNAQMAESPLLLLGGAAATLLKGRGALQDIDHLSLLRPLCKFAAEVNKVRDIVPTLRKAINIALSGTPGPVFVELPIDVLYPYALVQRELGTRGMGKGVVGKMIDWYLNNHLRDLFAGAWEKVDVSPLPVYRPLPSRSQVQKCAELLSKAKRPLIIIGSQTMLPPVSADDTRRALEQLGVPCFLGGMSRGLLGRNSPIHIRQKRKEALKDCDFVLLAGAVCDFRLSYGKILSRKSKIVIVNRNREQLLKNAGIFWSPTLSLQVDVASVLTQLASSLKGYRTDPQWLKLLCERDAEVEEKNKKMAEDPSDMHLNPLKVLHKLEDSLPDNAIIVADGGDFVGSAAYILRPRGPLKWLDPGAFGTLGVGGGFALGAKLCCPDSEVWVVYGDGSVGYTIAEFDTFTRHKVPVNAIVGNDACWSQIARDQVPFFNTRVACDLAFSDYHKIVEAFGAKGFILDCTNEDQIEAIFKQVQAENKLGNSVLINCLIGKSTFREGSISV